MEKFIALGPLFESRVRARFEEQQLMKTIGAGLTRVVPGEVWIEMPFNTAFTQQDDFLHAGVITSIVDSACGFAAYTLMNSSARVLSVEYKVNLLRPAAGETFIAVGRVIKPGRTLTVCSGEVTPAPAGEQTPIAVMQATMMTV